MSLGSLDIVDRAVTAAVADLLVDRDEFRTLDVAAHATVVSAHGRRATHPQFNALIGKNLSTNDSKLGIIRSSPDAQTNARWRRRTAGT